MGFILYFLIVLGFAVTVHELGHFLVAKWSGVKVERFSIGFGPKVIGFRWGETEYIIAPIPFGGYVKMAGDSPEEGAGDRPGDFFAASPWKRIGIVLAGPGMNFLLGFVIFFFLALIPGAQVLRNAVVARVEEHSLGAKAGLEAGDQIVAVDGEVVQYWTDLERLYVEAVEAERKDLGLSVLRGDRVEEITVDLRPRYKDYPALVGYVSPDSPAEDAGIEIGARIVSVEDEPIDSWEAMAKVMAQRFEEDADGEYRGLPTRIVWRDSEGAERLVTVVPDVEVGKKVRSVFGVARVWILDEKSYIDRVWPIIPDLGIRAWVRPVVGDVKKGSPAWQKGIRSGDLIVAINGEPVDNWYEMAGKIHGSFHPVPESRGGEVEADPITLTWMKPDGIHRTETIQPEAKWVPDWQGRRVDYAAIGIGPRLDRRRKGILASAGYASKKVWEYSFLFVRVIRGVVSREISPKAIGGPIAIAQISGEQGAWGWEHLFGLIAMLSVSFAVINLVPIPVLDGGHFLVYLIEGIRRKRLTLRQMELVQKLGLAILIPLIGLVFYNDLARYIPFHRIADLFRNLF